jgi:hypothetical protein
VDGLYRVGEVPVEPGTDDSDVHVHRCPPGTGDPAAAVHAVTAEVLTLLQKAGDRRIAVVVDPDDLSHAAVPGLVRSAQAEHPGRFTLIRAIGDIPAGAQGTHEPELSTRDGRLLAPRLARATPAAPPRLDPDGTVLVVGAGPMGRWVAAHLTDRYGVRDVLVISRTGTPVDGVRTAACDAADPEALAALLAGVPPLTGVVHCAGELADGLLESLDPAALHRLLRSKVDTALNLDRLTRAAPPALFVLFSSAAGVLGNLGQAAFAAASTFLAHPNRGCSWGLKPPASSSDLAM